MQDFEYQPRLISDLLILRPLVQEDWPEIYDVARDPKIWAQHPVPDRYKKDEFKKFFDEALRCNSLAIVDARTGDFCGSSRYYGLNVYRRDIEIGWTFMARKYWGGNYNRELKKLMLEHAFSYVDSVNFWVGKNNIRSRKAMEKIGAKLIPGVHTRELSGNLPYVIYRINKADGLKGSASA